MTDVVFELPTPQTPGYLRRLKALTEFQEAQKNEEDPLQRLMAMVEFLSGYVTQPADRDEAYEALLDASQEQIDGLFALIAGKNSGDIIPPTKGES
jgi:hypothetical protein